MSIELIPSCQMFFSTPIDFIGEGDGLLQGALVDDLAVGHRPPRPAQEVQPADLVRQVIFPRF